MARLIRPAAFAHRPPRRVRLLVWAAAALLGLGFCIWMLGSPLFLDQLELLGYDRLLRALPAAPPSTGVAVVDIDEASLAELGQWPLPRYQVARMLDALHQAGAAAIGVDILFPEPDRLSLDRLRASFQQGLNVELGVARVPPALRDNDAILAASVARSGAVLGVWFDFGQALPERPERPERPGQPGLPAASAATLPPPGVLLARSPRAPDPLPIPQATRALQPIPQLAAAMRSAAFHNALPDPDGRIRRAPLLIQRDREIYPSLALAAVTQALGAPAAIAQAGAAGVEQVRVGALRIPTDAQGNLLLPFRPDSARRFDRISALDLLQGRVDPARLRGRIVFLGSSATAASDQHPTPFARQFPGLLIHAVAADAMLRQDFLVAPGWAVAAQLALVLLALAGAAFLLCRYLLWVCAVAGAAGLAGLWLAALGLLAAHRLVISPVPPMLALGAGLALMGLIRFRSEEQAAIRTAQELAMAQDCAIIGLVSTVETRDAETGQHIIRTRSYVRYLAEHLATHPRFRRHLGPEAIEAIVKSAALHDIGKVGVPDAILKKPGPLDATETHTMHQHTVLGQRILERAFRLAGADPSHSFLARGVEIARSHHERWDGLGYPSGLKGEAIPVAARLMALADVYDAMRSRRRYKEPRSHEEARAVILDGAGSLFDPDVVLAFQATQERFRLFSERHPDQDLDLD